MVFFIILLLLLSFGFEGKNRYYLAALCLEAIHPFGHSGEPGKQSGGWPGPLKLDGIMVPAIRKSAIRVSLVMVFFMCGS
jgi:hypothetical protein